jgi:hypothetical protein
VTPERNTRSQAVNVRGQVAKRPVDLIDSIDTFHGQEQDGLEASKVSILWGGLMEELSIDSPHRS